MAVRVRSDLEEGSWLNIVAGIAIVGATLLSGGMLLSLWWPTLILGLLVLALAAYEAFGWDEMAPRRRLAMSALSALLGVALLLLWLTATEEVNMRRIQVALALVVIVVSAVGAWRLMRRGTGEA